MIIVLTTNEAPRLTDLDRLDRLHAELHGSLESAQLGELVDPDGDDHVWLDVAMARASGVASADDPAFGGHYDAMIEYARGKGWLNDAGSHVRAHVERAD